MAKAASMARSRGPDVRVASASKAALGEVRSAANTLVPTPPRVALTGGVRHSVTGETPELGVSVVQDLPLAGVGGARRELATNLIDAQAADVKHATRSASARAALAWIDLANAQRVFALRSEAKAHADSLARIAEARVKSGAGDPIERALAASEAADARASVLEAEGRVVEASNALRTATGIDPDASVIADGDPTALYPDTIDEAAVVARASNDPVAVAPLEARLKATYSEERLARAVFAPPLGLGINWLREGTGDHVVTAVVSIPLPFVHPGAFDAARQRAAAATLTAEVTRRRDEVARAARLAVHEHEHARELSVALDAAVAPSRDAVRLATAAWTAGTVDLSRVLQARSRALAVDERKVAALADVARADVHLAELDGSIERLESKE
jgi:outer membrane protein TolC